MTRNKNKFFKCNYFSKLKTCPHSRLRFSIARLFAPKEALSAHSSNCYSPFNGSAMRIIASKTIKNCKNHYICFKKLKTCCERTFRNNYLDLIDLFCFCEKCNKLNCFENI